MNNIPDVMSVVSKGRNLFFIAIGIAVLLFKRFYSGPFEKSVHDYAGNFFVSFAIYFLLLQLPVPQKWRQLTAAVLALAAVELFEVFNGFGFMSNTYDSFDLIANLIGVVVSVLVDGVLNSLRKPRAREE